MSIVTTEHGSEYILISSKLKFQLRMYKVQFTSQGPIMSRAITPGGHATEAPPRWRLSVFTDLWGSLRGRLGAKSASQGWASEQEGAVAGIRARENRCEKSPRAAALGKRCMSLLSSPSSPCGSGTARRIGRVRGFAAQPLRNPR
jgi:hypothetical protein